MDDTILEGKIILINKSIYTVKLENNMILNCSTRGKLRNKNIKPIVGDNVLIDKHENTIEDVLPRKNSLVRPQVANIDKLFIIMSTGIPKFSSYLLDKFLVIAHSNNIEPIIVMTKLDTLSLMEKLKIFWFMRYYRSIGYKIYTNTQLKRIKKEFRSSVVALTGQTGSGKSTLLNRVDTTLLLKTGEISEALGRGKHTTRLVELIEISDGLIADTPGFSSLEIDLKKDELKKYFREFNVECKYRSCTHVNEDGCKVKQLLEKGKIQNFRYENYLKLLEELK